MELRSRGEAGTPHPAVAASAALGLDVYEGEPRVTEGLRSLENVVLLPHLGSATQETRVAMGMRVLRNVEALFAGDTPPDIVS